MRPRADEDDVFATFLGIGSAHGVGEPASEEEIPVGRLIVPDPEQRHGWREHYVKPAPRLRAAARTIGFRPR